MISRILLSGIRRMPAGTRYEKKSLNMSSIKRAALWMIKMVFFAACAYGTLALIVYTQI